MNFRSGATDEPDINLIPFIDILLVVLIFLMLTTTFNRYRELRVNLPVADAKEPQEAPRQIRVAIGADGRFAVNQRTLESASVEALMSALQQAAHNKTDAMVIIHADASATHQSVVNVMEAARRSGLAQITFSTQASGQGSSGS